MAHPPPRPASYADLLQVPEHLVAELLNGQLHTSPRPAPRHTRASSLLGVEVGRCAALRCRPPGLGWFVGGLAAC